MKLSFSKKLISLIMMFLVITAYLLVQLVLAYNEPIYFGEKEVVGNQYQRPVETVLRTVARHRFVAQRALNGVKESEEELDKLSAKITAGFEKLEKIHSQVGETLDFTQKGLASRKRDHLSLTTVAAKWKNLNAKQNNLKPEESNDLHASLIADLRGMITHLGDTSNLILDPDLDSYYLMDMTLLALPQAQDRVQNVITELEPIVRTGAVSNEDRIKASIFAALMNEADYERIKGDFQTVRNEDANFFGKSASIESTLAPMNEKFLAKYKAFVDVVNQIAAGKAVSPELFVETSDQAFNASFEYWDASADELDKLLTVRIGSLRKRQINLGVISILGLIICSFVAWLLIRRWVENLRTIVNELNRSSKEVSSASKSSGDSATRLSEASTEQAASLQQTMASVEQISAMVRQNADSALRTKESVDANSVVSEQGSKSVDEMLMAIDEIKSTNEEILSQMELSNKEFGEIVKIISEIGDKTTVINEIVFQTKLLSFNASVEAARAGEHGKGFAVVAEEVGNLAQMSGNAAKEITNMLSDSIKRVNKIVEDTKIRVDSLVEVGKDKVAMGQSTAQKCREALTRITENARGIANMIAEISNASKEQSQGISEINKAIAQLDQVTQANSAVAQSSSQQGQQLNAEARSLSSTIGHLVGFVEGAAELAKSPAPAAVKPATVIAINKAVAKARPEKARTEKPVVASKPSSRDSSKTVRASVKAGTEKPNAKEVKFEKKAVGQNEVPSADDPGFEEF